MRDDVIRIIQEHSRESNFMAEIDELLQNLSTLNEDELEARLGIRAQSLYHSLQIPDFLI